MMFVYSLLVWSNWLLKDTLTSDVGIGFIVMVIELAHPPFGIRTVVIEVVILPRVLKTVTTISGLAAT